VTRAIISRITVTPHARRSCEAKSAASRGASQDGAPRCRPAERAWVPAFLLIKCCKPLTALIEKPPPTAHRHTGNPLLGIASVHIGGVSRRRWRAHPTPSVPTLLGNSRFGSLSRYGCRSFPGNVGVWTSAGPRAQDPDLCSRASCARAWRMVSWRAPWTWQLLGAARPAFPAQDGPAAAPGTALFAAGRAERGGAAGIGIGAAAAFRPGGRSSSISRSMMPPVLTPGSCALFAHCPALRRPFAACTHACPRPHSLPKGRSRRCHFPFPPTSYPFSFTHPSTPVEQALERQMSSGEG
jgi:hypothetical protein